MTKAKIISVEITKGEAGLLHAMSPQMSELFVSGESKEELIEAVPEVIRAIYKAHGKDVTVLEAESSDTPIPMPWVILSNADMATRAIK